MKELKMSSHPHPPKNNLQHYEQQQAWEYYIIIVMEQPHFKICHPTLKTDHMYLKQTSDTVSCCFHSTTI